MKGEISPETFEEWNRETGSAKLPERASKKSAKKTTKAKPKAKTAAKRSRKRPK